MSEATHTRENNTPALAAGGADGKHFGEFARAMGQVLSGADLYGMDHRITVSAAEAAFEMLQAIFERLPRLRIDIVEGELRMDNRPFAVTTPLAALFIERLVVMDIGGFTLGKGMMADEFVLLLRLLSDRGSMVSEGRFAAAVQRGALGHVEVNAKRLRELSDDEVVVRKQDAKGKPGDSGSMGEAEVQQIVAFLRGELDSSPAMEALDPSTADPARLADLIMNAAAIRQRQSPEGGETLGELIVGCLRRTYEGLQRGGALKSQKGRKAACKMLTVIEKDLLDRLRDLAGDRCEAMADVSEAAADMREGIEVDAVVSHYLKRRAAALDSERELKRMATRFGSDRLETMGVRDALLEGGMSPSGWRRIAVGSGPVVTEGAGDLAVMLDELNRLLERRGVDEGGAAEAVGEHLEKVGAAVEGTAVAVDRRIDALADVVAASGADSDSRRRAWHALQEVIQELCQPMSVVNCTIDMMQGRKLGAVPSMVSRALAVAHASAVRMEGLIDRMLDICGLPDALHPPSDAASADPRAEDNSGDGKT